MIGFITSRERLPYVLAISIAFLLAGAAVLLAST